MVTCYLRYVIDPFKLKEFEHYGKIWMLLVERFRGQHHGYFLPSEGANKHRAGAVHVPQVLRRTRNIARCLPQTQRAKLRSSTRRTLAAS
jgi:hypothetical protein